MDESQASAAATVEDGASSVPMTQSSARGKRKVWTYALTALLGALIGGCIGRLFPPFVLDDEFWRSFLTSAGFGGVAALAAAIIAFLAAWYTSHRSASNATADRVQREVAAENDRLQREAAGEKDRLQRQTADQHSQWWARFTWATGAALDPASRSVGATSMIGLIDHPWASPEDADIAIAVADVLEQMVTEADLLGAEEGEE